MWVCSPLTLGSRLTSQGLLRIAVVGAPPFARGSDVPGRDLEQQLVSAFPGCALFVEKPVSSGPEDECWRVAKVLEDSGALVGVGYMLRYLKGTYTVQAVREPSDSDFAHAMLCFGGSLCVLRGQLCR